MRKKVRALHLTSEGAQSAEKKYGDEYQGGNVWLDAACGKPQAEKTESGACVACGPAGALRFGIGIKPGEGYGNGAVAVAVKFRQVPRTGDA